MGAFDPYFVRVFHHSPSELAKTLPFYVNGLGWKAQQSSFFNQRKAGSFYDYQIQIVLRGAGQLNWKSEVLPMRSGDLFFLDLSEEHCYGSDAVDPWEIIWVHFGGMNAEVFYNLAKEAGPVFRPENSHELGHSFRKLIHLFSQRPIGLDVIASHMISGILTEIVMYAQTRDYSEPKSENLYTDEVNRAIAYMERKYASPLKMEDIAKQAMMSTTHFSRVFKRATGFTVKEYLTKCRLTQAKQLLTHTKLPLIEVAELVGFNDQSYLGRIFRKYEKTTPLNYRHNMLDLH